MVLTSIKNLNYFICFELWKTAIIDNTSKINNEPWGKEEILMNESKINEYMKNKMANEIFKNCKLKLIEINTKNTSDQHSSSGKSLNQDDIEMTDSSTNLESLKNSCKDNSSCSILNINKNRTVPKEDLKSFQTKVS